MDRGWWDGCGWWCRVMAGMAAEGIPKGDGGCLAPGRDDDRRVGGLRCLVLRSVAERDAAVLVSLTNDRLAFAGDLSQR